MTCHICHYRRPEGVLFPCARRKHVYCASHLEKRLGLTLTSMSSLKHCPICALECQCTKCKSALETKARATMKLDGDPSVAHHAEPPSTNGVVRDVHIRTEP